MSFSAIASFSLAASLTLMSGVPVQGQSNSYQSVVTASGEQVDLYQIEISPGSASVSMVWSENPKLARATWGASYATSTEIAYLVYLGKAKAAANIYQNMRITSVCIWYSRGSLQVTGQVCSNATSNGVAWFAGPEVSVTGLDTLDWNAPKTILNIQTTRISPNVFP